MRFSRKEVSLDSPSAPPNSRRLFAARRSVLRTDSLLHPQQNLMQCRDCETVQELDDRIAVLRKEIDEMFR